MQGGRASGELAAPQGTPDPERVTVANEGPQVFLLSPANSGGVRMHLLTRPQAQFALALQLRSEEGASLGECFTFASGLYFRGKRLYAQAFARPPPGTPRGLVITPGRGLVDLNTRVHPEDLRRFAEVPVDPEDARFREPLERDAAALAERLGAEGRAVLLGSVATAKYTQILQRALGERLLFPAEFVGRGDMSRGGLLLRAVRAGEELTYLPVAGAVVKGKRPPKLQRRR